MPSYIGHTACALELMSRLKLNKVEQTKFIIGNMIPDIKQVDIDYSLDEFINKRNIQRSKRITHFRRQTNKILEFPNCDVFLNKYENEIKKHIETLAYFFHLCTDYYYFRVFLPKEITFLSKDLEEVTEKDNFYYVKINKSSKIIKAKSFFSKLSKKGIYKEYTRSNSYLIKKYKIRIDTDSLRDYIKKNGFESHVEEIDTTKIYDVFERIDKAYDRITNEEMLVFDSKELDNFVTEVVEIFLKEYKYLLKKYI